MKTFACGSVIPGCDARFVAATDDKILAEVASHARAEHGIDEIDDSTRELVLANLQAA